MKAKLGDRLAAARVTVAPVWAGCWDHTAISRQKTADSAQGADTKLDSIFDSQKRNSLISSSHENGTTENITLNLILQVEELQVKATALLDLRYEI